MNKREIRKKIAALEGEVVACELPASVRAELVARHTAKHYPGPCEMPASVRMVAIVERQQASVKAADVELVKLEAVLAKLQARVAKRQ